MGQRGSEWHLVFFTILTQMAVGAFISWGLPALLLPHRAVIVAVSRSILSMERQLRILIRLIFIIGHLQLQRLIAV